MNELKEIAKFLLGFIPWLLFLFLSGHTLAALERSIVICFLASVIFGFKELRKGFILQWGTLFFFAMCLVTVDLFGSIFIARNMSLICNLFLACLIWATVLIGRPFTLQYATAELPRELWNDPALIRSCRFIAVVWALLMTVSALISYFRLLHPRLYPEYIYFDISMAMILSGSVFTVYYKKYKRSRRRAAE